MSRRKQTQPTQVDVNDEISEGDQDVDATGEQERKNKKRPSKKEVLNYKFSEEQHRIVAEFVRDHPALCNKKCRDWANPSLKEDLWRELAAQFPGCTWQQCRKFYEAKRTDYGKIAKKRKRSGSSARELTAREEIIIEIWAFMADHIAHEKTESSERFSRRRRSSSESSLSAHSAQSFAIQRKKIPSRQESVESSSNVPSTSGIDANVITDILKEAQNLSALSAKPRYPAGVQEFVNYLASRLIKIPEHLHGNLFAKILAMIQPLETESTAPQPTPGQMGPPFYMQQQPQYFQQPPYQYHYQPCPSVSASQTPLMWPKSQPPASSSADSIVLPSPSHSLIELFGPSSPKSSRNCPFPQKSLETTPRNVQQDQAL